MTGQEKLAFLRRAAREDAQDARLVRIARLLWAASGGRRRLFVILAHALAGRGIRQVRDLARVGAEDIAGLTRTPTPNDATDALARGADDCDAKARLFVALCLAVGIAAEVEPVWAKANPADLQHVYGSVWLDGRRQPVELTLARAVVGEGPFQVPKERNGQWLQT